MGTTPETLASELAPLFGDLGLDIFDVELSRSLVRIAVTKAGGVSLDELARANQVASGYLDEHEPFPGRYTLEVTSPGIERTLRRPAHFTAALGEQIRLKTSEAAVPGRRAEGRLLAADDEGITLLLDGGEELRIAYSEIERAKTHFVWGAEKKPSPSRAGAPRGQRRALHPVNERIII
jgi:ribosome maturation factor RimP